MPLEAKVAATIITAGFAFLLIVDPIAHLARAAVGN